MHTSVCLHMRACLLVYVWHVNFRQYNTCSACAGAYNDDDDECTVLSQACVVFDNVMFTNATPSTRGSHTCVVALVIRI